MIDERRENAAIQLATYQRRVSNYYNKRVCHKTFEEGDLVLRKSTITNALREDGKLQLIRRVIQDLENVGG